MKRIIGIVVLAVLWASPAWGAQPFTGSCGIAPDSNNPGFAILTMTGLSKIGPGKIIEAVPSGPAPTNPTAIPFITGASTQSSVFAYFVPGTYSIAQVFLVNDKTGNGKGDGSGDQYTLIATNVCSAALP